MSNFSMASLLEEIQMEVIIIALALVTSIIIVTIVLCCIWRRNRQKSEPENQIIRSLNSSFKYVDVAVIRVENHRENLRREIQRSQNSRYKRSSQVNQGQLRSNRQRGQERPVSFPDCRSQIPRVRYMEESGAGITNIPRSRQPITYYRAESPTPPPQILEAPYFYSNEAFEHSDTFLNHLTDVWFFRLKTLKFKL